MNILDTNGINKILQDKLTLSEEYYLAPDVAEEAVLTEILHKAQMPRKIINLSNTGYFNQVVYVDHYKTILNKYGGRSFYNMTGFGDVSILATLHMLIDYFDPKKHNRLFDISQPITVFTHDAGLVKKINAEFFDKNIVVKNISEIS